MPLDPDAKGILDFMAGTPMPDPYTLTAEVMRQAMGRPMAEGPATPCARVENLTIQGGEVPLNARLYANSTGKALPVVVFYHGGGWVLCGLDSHDETCRKIAVASGWAVLSIDYRLAPEAKFPGPFEDCYYALTWTAKHGAELGLDTSRIAVAGDSAGGNLAAAVALAARDRGGPRLAAQILIYPVTDRNFETVSYVENGEGYFLTTRMMQWFWDQYLTGPEHDSNPLAAPLQAKDVSNLPPATVMTAEYDPLRDEGEAYGRRLAEANPHSIVKRFDGVFHGFAGMPVAKAAEVTALVAKRLKEVE